MSRFSFPWYRLAVLSLTGLTACANVDVPDLPTALPAAWSREASGPTAARAPDLRSWWKVFDDAQLNQLVDQALAQNLDVAQAASRLRQARLLAGRANAAYLPTLSTGTRSAQIPSATDTFVQASLDSIWELGLFGAREATQRDAAASIAAAQADVQAARVSVVAEVVRTYADLRTAQSQLALLGEFDRIDTKALQLVDVRIRTHLAAADERDRLLAQQAQDRAALSEPNEVLAHAAMGLAVLLGKAEPDPAWYQAGPQLTLGSVTIDQVPADLLRTRPEIHKAESAVDQAAGALGLARADLYPHIALGASFLASYNVTRNAKSPFNTGFAIGPIVDIPLFDWGRRKDLADARQEALDESVLAYRQALLTGYSEVQSALVSLDFQGQRETHLGDAAAVLDKRMASQQTLGRLGLSSEYDRLDIDRTAVQARLDLVVARARRDLAFVALYKSLGGAPLPAADVVAQVQP